MLPDNFDAARRALTQRFPEARDGLATLLDEMEQSTGPAPGDATLAQTLDRLFGDNEAVKAAYLGT